MTGELFTSIFMLGPAPSRRVGDHPLCDGSSSSVRLRQLGTECGGVAWSAAARVASSSAARSGSGLWRRAGGGLLVLLLLLLLLLLLPLLLLPLGPGAALLSRFFC